MSIRLLLQSLGNRKRPIIDDAIDLLQWAEPLVEPLGTAVTSR